MNNRLADLRKLAITRGFDLESPLANDNLRVPQDLAIFLARVKCSQQYLKASNLSIEALEEIRDKLPLATQQQEQRLMENAEGHYSFITENHKKNKNLLDLYEQDIKVTKEKDPDGKNNETRIKQNLFGSLLTQYEDSVRNFSSVQTTIKAIVQSKTVRDFEIIMNKKADESDKARLLEDPTFVQSTFTEKLTGVAHIKLQNAFHDIEERHRDIIKLEQSVMEVHRLLEDLAVLVKMQGEMIDNIEKNLLEAKDHIEEGEKYIEQAKENMEDARKKKCIILAIVVAVLVVIMIPIIATNAHNA